MARYYFIWKGVNSADMGILMQSPPPVIKPEERIEHITIPGRTGEMTLTEGDDIYQSYIHTIPIAVREMARVRPAENWLRGDGELILCTQPEFSQRARVIGSATLERHSLNTDVWVGDVQFYCDPVKHAIGELDIEIGVSGQTITNPGAMRAFPTITVVGASGTVTIRIGAKTLVIPNVSGGVTIDCENEWILNGNTPQMNACSGEFPDIPTGESTVLFTGASKLMITPNWRYL